MPFCSNCGNELNEKDKFCAKCGKAVENNNNITARSQVFEGNIHKCPNCGAVVNAFVTKCETCGFEFRDSNTSFAVSELSKRINEIEATRKPTKNSALGAAFGITSSNIVDDKLENLIRSFSIPNTKEDIFEFMILASSNIDSSLFNVYANGAMMPQERVDKLKVTKAWIAKFEQAYEKARLSFGSDPDFIRIEEIYQSKQKEIKQDKGKQTKILLGCCVMMFVMILLMLLMLVLGSIFNW